MTPPSRDGRTGEVFRAFLVLGVTSFGGPVAHLGYFRTAFVERRRWIGERDYASLVALCQFLPGPSSSQVGFLIGLHRAGLPGALAASAAFTAPSAAIMLALGLGVTGGFGALLAPLMLVAVAVVAHAVWGMARGLIDGVGEAAIAAAALGVALVTTGLADIAIIVGAALLGLLLARRSPPPASDASAPSPRRRPAAVALGIAAALLLLLPVAATHDATIALADRAYRAGALVFGGGHVVLPLLQGAFVDGGLVDEAAFLSGYGAAQLLPGPLFAIAAYVGAVATAGPGGVAGGLVALVAIFLPGLLLAYGALPWWEALRRRRSAARAIRGANAAVVGLLAAALWDPVWREGVGSATDAAIAVAGFAALTRLPLWVVAPAIVAARLIVGA